MKHIKKMLAVLAVTGLLMNGGCSLLPPAAGSGQGSGDAQAVAPEAADRSEPTALTVGDTEVPVSRAMVYAFLMQLPMGDAAGMQIWDGVHPEGGKLDDRLRSEVKKQITQITVLADKAAAAGMALTDEEKANADARAALLFAQYPGLSEAGTDEAAAQAVYRQSMLAGRYYDEMTKDYLPDLTEEEKASCNVREVHQIFVAADDISHLGKNKNQEQLANTLLKRAQNGEDFDVLAERYSSDGNQLVVVLNDQGYAFDVDAWVDETFLQEALKLEAGQMSGAFQTDRGWHVLYCASVDDPDLCEEAQTALFEKKKQGYFAEILKDDLSAVVVKEGEGWTQIGVLTL